MFNVKCSFDFDDTLSRPCIQQYASSLINKGYEIWIVTARFDSETYRIQFNTSYENAIKTNRDLFEVANNIGIPYDRIKFMNMQDKYNFFLDKDFIWHLDDDRDENKLILKYTNTKGISSWGNSSWKYKCQRLIKNYLLKNENV